MKGKLYIWHRRIALIVFLPLLLFGLSGLLHPVMRLTAPETAARFYPQPQWPEQLPDISLLAETLPLADSAGLRPVKVADQWFVQHWRSRDQGSNFYSLRGEAAPKTEQRYAVQLARHFSGDQESTVRAVKLHTAFGRHYSAINRLLPVWEVRFNRDDNLSVFVDIRQDRFATQIDDTRRGFMQLFQWLHVWSFLDQDGVLKPVVFIILMTASTLLGASGLYLFIVLPIRKRKNSSLKTLHAWSGVFISIALLMFVVSGLIRTLEKRTPEVRGVMSTHSFSLTKHADFNAIKQALPEVKNAYPHQFGDEIVWQVIAAKGAEHWLRSSSWQPLEQGAERFAEHLLNELTSPKAVIQQIRTIRNFKADKDYGFIDKRLPVIALDTNEGSYYIDTRDRVLSVKVDQADRVYSWVFRYLHKWRFADPLTLNGRDALISLFILLIVMTSLLGISSWLKGKRRRKTKKPSAASRIEPTLSM